MKPKTRVGRNGESQSGLYLLSALVFVILYGLPLLTYLLDGTPH